MKKTIINIAVLIGTLLLVSCQEASPNGSFETLGPVVEGGVRENGDIIDYNFDSYEGLVSHFSSSANADNSIVQSEKSEHGEAYEAFVNAMTTSKTIEVPMFGEEPFPLEDRDGYEISLYPEEWCGLPWIWYHCMYGEERVSIQMTYPTAITEIEYAADATCAQVLRQINEGAVNTHNYQNFESYENVYSSELQLADTTASAIVYQLGESERVLVVMYHHDFLILMRADSSVMNDPAFWSSLSFAPLR